MIQAHGAQVGNLEDLSFLELSGIEKQHILQDISENWIPLQTELTKPGEYRLSKQELSQRRMELNDIIVLAGELNNKLSEYIVGGQWFSNLYDPEGNVICAFNEPRDSAGMFYPYIEQGEIYTPLTNGKVINITMQLAHCSYGPQNQSVLFPLSSKNGQLCAILAYIFYGIQLSQQLQMLLHMGIQLLKTKLRAQHELRHYSQSIIDCMKDCVMILDDHMNIIQANATCAQLLYTSAYSHLNQHVSCFFAAPDSLCQLSQLPGRQIQFRPQGTDTSVCCTVVEVKQIPQRNTMIIFRAQPSGLCPNGSAFEKIIGKTPAIKKVTSLAEQIAIRRSTVLIQGETGTGKELLAEGIHLASGRTGPFVSINCGAIPPSLLQSELLGYENGTFTGAQKGGKVGKFVHADSGTLFLDEIGEMPLDMQVSLLRVLQERVVTPLGSVKQIPVNVRVLAATNKDLKKMVEEGTFREDLYYRLNVINLVIPPLRTRYEDVPLIMQHVLQRLCAEDDIPVPTIDEAAMELLKRYQWPGNVRELINIAERIAFLCTSGHVTADWLRRHCLPDCELAEGAAHDIQSYEAHAIETALWESNWNISAAAKRLGITRPTLYSRIRQLELHKPNLATK